MKLTEQYTSMHESRAKWDAMSDKQRSNIRTWLGQHSGNSFYKSMLAFLTRSGFLTDKQVDKLPPQAWQ